MWQEIQRMTWRERAKVAVCSLIGAGVVYGFPWWAGAIWAAFGGHE